MPELLERSYGYECHWLGWCEIACSTKMTIYYRLFSIANPVLYTFIEHMISLMTEADVLSEAPRLMREARLAMALRQEDLAQRSGVPIATLRRFERSGRIGFPGFAKLVVTLGLADRLIEALTPKPAASPKDIESFLATPKRRQRVRVRRA